MNNNIRAALNIMVARSQLLNTTQVKNYENYICTANRLILNKINPQAGQYRKENKIISGTYYTPCDPEDIQYQMLNYCYDLTQLMSKKTNNYIKAAAEMHCRLASIQPFDDGNKRTARLVCSHILLNKAGVDIDYTNFDTDLYISTTISYYNTKDTQPFYNFLKSNIYHQTHQHDKNIYQIDNDQQLFALEQIEEEEEL